MHAKRKEENEERVIVEYPPSFRDGVWPLEPE